MSEWIFLMNHPNAVYKRCTLETNSHLEGRKIINIPNTTKETGNTYTNTRKINFKTKVVTDKRRYFIMTKEQFIKKT